MLNIIFAGTPEFAVPALQALAQSEHRVLAVYTQPDRPAGRGRKLQASAVKDCAGAFDIPVLQPLSFHDANDVQQLQSFNADLMVVAAYGLILPPKVLQAPRFGCMNIHASLLPRWRGAAPIQRAILAGDHESGITIMQMDTGLDTGDMLAKQSLAIDSNWNAGDLQDSLKQIGAGLLIQTIAQLEAGKIEAEPQNEAFASYASKLHKSEAAIDWGKQAAELLREIRAFVPWPVSFTQFENNPMRVWQASVVEGDSSLPPGTVILHDKGGVQVSCGDGILNLSELQFAGKKRCDAAQALNARNLSGLKLG